jgi:cell division transport system ATP-binding protein
MIRLEHVYKSYENGTQALRDLSITLEDGEFAFLVGPSGSGKSTIIKLITGEISCTEGEVIVNGYDMSRISRRRMPRHRRMLGVIFQDFRLIENKSVYENVALAMRIAGASGREIKERVPYVLSLVGLEDMMHAFPRQLSGGEQQRVAIARALVNNPKVIIADEHRQIDPSSAPT